MPKFKTNIKLVVLLVAAFELQLELLDRQAQNHQNPYVFLVRAVELRFDFRSELRMAKPETIKNSMFSLLGRLSLVLSFCAAALGFGLSFGTRVGDEAQNLYQTVCFIGCGV